MNTSMSDKSISHFILYCVEETVVNQSCIITKKTTLIENINWLTILCRIIAFSIPLKRNWSFEMINGVNGFARLWFLSTIAIDVAIYRKRNIKSCKERIILGSWVVRSINSGKLNMIKSEMVTNYHLSY